MADSNADTRSGAKSHQPQSRCAYCGSDAGIVWVHGHGQCAQCGINTNECCQGEQCEFVSYSSRSSRPNS